MPTSTTFDSAQRQLENSELGKLPHVAAAWRAVQWTESPAQDAPFTIQVNLTNPKRINWSKSLFSLAPEAQTEAILREFGVSLYQCHAPQEAKTAWELKYCLPERGQIDAIQGKISSDKFSTYRELTESFSTAVDRLVCLHVCNALLANGVPRKQARNLNICQYGATSDFCNLRRMHSIRPLLTAYAERALVDCPGKAFADVVMHRTPRVHESSVKDAFKNLITATFEACR